MLAWIEGQRAEATVIKPVVVNVTLNHVVERPRRRVGFEPTWIDVGSQTWPPSCEFADDFVRSTKEVGCLELRDHVPLETCWRCYLAKEG